MSQPSLRITHFEAQTPPADYVFDVWNPLENAYERLPTFEDGMERVQRRQSGMEPFPWLHQPGSRAYQRRGWFCAGTVVETGAAGAASAG